VCSLPLTFCLLSGTVHHSAIFNTRLIIIAKDGFICCVSVIESLKHRSSGREKPSKECYPPQHNYLVFKITIFVYFVEDLKAQVLTPTILQQLGAILECHPALVVLGQSCQAKAALVNALLGEAILPQGGSSWRWVRFLYGLSSHIAITLSSDFEVVEDLQSHDKAWTVVPEEDLKRSEAEEKVNKICKGIWSSGMLHCA
jgi:hypothetical protein